MTDEAKVLWIPSAHHWTGREGQKPRYVILHGTAGFTTAQDVAHYFAESSTQASTNYVVGRDGVIVECVREADAPWANGGISGPAGRGGDGIHHDSWWDSGINPNLLSIAIEHVKPHIDNSDVLTEAQKRASFRLVQHICERHNIPKRYANNQGGITGHFSMDPVNRSRCPGPYPWDELWASLKQNEAPNILQINQTHNFFVETVPGQRWHCPKTGQDIVYGILQYYRTCSGVGLHGLSQYGLPVSPEMRVPGTRQAVYQVFERGALVYDVKGEVDRVPGLSGPCYPAHINNGFALTYLKKLSA